MLGTEDKERPDFSELGIGFCEGPWMETKLSSRSPRPSRRGSEDSEDGRNPERGRVLGAGSS
jgi:hypothetical protein